jgi:hypothetical protein
MSEKFKEYRKKGKGKWKFLNDEEIETMAADMVNDTFQGLNWDRFLATDTAAGRTMTRQIQRGMIYSFYGPDRIFSVINRYKKIIAGDNKWEYFKTFLRGTFMSYILMNIAQYLLSGHFCWDNKRDNKMSLQLDFLPDAKGNPMAVDFMATRGEIYKFIHRPSKWYNNKSGTAFKVYDYMATESPYKKNLKGLANIVSPLSFSFQPIQDFAMQKLQYIIDGKKSPPRTGDYKNLETALIATGLGFIGLNNTYRSGKNSSANLEDMIAGKASPQEFMFGSKISLKDKRGKGIQIAS